MVACGDISISHTGYTAGRYRCVTISFIHNHVGEEDSRGFDYGTVLLLQHSRETFIVAPCSLFQSWEIGVKLASIATAPSILLFSWVYTVRLFSGYVSNMIPSRVVDGCADSMLNEWYEVVMGIMLKISGIGWPHDMHHDRTVQDRYTEVLWRWALEMLRNVRMSHLLPAFCCPWLESDGCSLWFWNRKEYFMSKSGRDRIESNSLEMMKYMSSAPYSPSW